jgi:cell division protein FtsB
MEGMRMPWSARAEDRKHVRMFDRLRARLTVSAGLPGGFGYGQRRRVVVVGAGLLVAAISYHVFFGQNGVTAYRKKRADSEALSLQLKQLAAENDALKGHVERLDKDPGAIEHQARETLHYTRPGEVIITLGPESLGKKQDR